MSVDAASVCKSRPRDPSLTMLGGREIQEREVILIGLSGPTVEAMQQHWRICCTYVSVFCMVRHAIVVVGRLTPLCRRLLRGTCFARWRQGFPASHAAELVLLNCLTTIQP